jgi:LacI family transcriptional regulator
MIPRQHRDNTAKPRARSGERLSSFKATMRDVAELAGVSAMTVSRVVNGLPTVRPSTRQAVMTAIRQLGFVPSAAARSLVLGPDLRIGILYCPQDHMPLDNLIISALAQAEISQVRPILVPCSRNEVAECMTRLKHYAYDGALLCLPDDLRYEEIGCAAMPVIRLAESRSATAYRAFGIDYVEIAKNVTKHFLDLGHRRLAVATSTAPTTREQDFLLGAADKASSTEGSCLKHIELDANSPPSLMEFCRHLTSANAPTAVLATSDKLAAAILVAVSRVGLQVPGDVSICGYGDTAIAAACWPQLTTIRDPLTDLVKHAIEWLAAQARSTKIVDIRDGAFQPRLIRRHSDAAPSFRI